MEKNYELPDNYLYISHLDDDFKFWVLPLYPDGVTDTMGSTFQPTNALGRTAPVYTYSNSGPRTVQINLELHRDLMTDVNVGRSNSKLVGDEDYIDNLINALRAIVVPRYNLSNKAVEPPLIALRLGNEIFVKGILSSSIGLTYQKPILYNNKYAYVTLSLSIDEVDPYDATEIFRNGGFRGVVKTLKKGMNLEDDIRG